MKKLILPLFFLCLFASAYSQTDTLFTRKQEKIPCKIVEINELEIKYKLATSLDGPTYVINKSTCTKYTLANGFSELLITDQMLIENEHAEIINNKSVVKLHPFSFLNQQISVAYEQVLKVGTNLDMEAGYINSSIGNTNRNNTLPVYSGAYLKPGVKFLIGQDFSLKGLKYAHPMKGKYIKLDLVIAYLNFQNIHRDETDFNGTIIRSVSTNANVFAYGGFVNFGRQYILGNILTLDWYLGLGITGATSSYTNKNYTNVSAGSNYKIVDYATSLTNYHGFQRFPGIGLSFTGGFRIGFILPEKAVKKPTTKMRGK